MNPQRVYSFLSRHRLSILQFVFPVLLLVLCIVGVGATTAQSPKAEREFDNKIPAHVPIKVKLKNVEKVKDLENDDWLRDFEIEVTNTGTKPIYFLYIGYRFVDVKRDSGASIGNGFQYGRSALIDLKEQLRPEDVPILPGETHTFKLHEDYVKGWKYYRTQIEKKPHPKKIEIFFSDINHGDGTGYHTTGGIYFDLNAVGSKPLKINFRSTGTAMTGERYGFKQDSLDVIAMASDTVPERPSDLPFKLSSPFLPAYFLPVNFYPAEVRI